MTKRNRSYRCDDCLIVFTIFTHIPNLRHVHCPKCGDHIYVSPHIGYRTLQKLNPKKIKFQESEVNVLKRYIAGQLQMNQVMMMLGRSNSSIRYKVRRMKAEMML